MKFKEKKDISFYGKMILIFFLCCSVTIIIRTVQTFLYIDRETGFSTGGTALSVMLCLLIVGSTLFFMAVAFSSKKTANISLDIEKNSLMSVISVMLSLSFIYDSMSAFLSSFDSVGNVPYGVPVFQSMMLSGTIPKFFQSVFALLSAVYFIFFAKAAIKGNNAFNKHKILAVSPVCWAGFRLIHRFVEQISYIRVSELLYELVLLAFLVMFFMAFAQLSSGVYIKNARWRILGLGLPTALISLTLNIPRLIYVLSAGADELYGKYPFKVCDFVIALFIVVLAVNIIGEKTKAVEA
ncbi:MAG: hypothetical protein IJB74_00820 [Clostridia bacterium]|nr:hypothetical protein [Clostridia bacterium]